MKITLKKINYYDDITIKIDTSKLNETKNIFDSNGWEYSVSIDEE